MVSTLAPLEGPNYSKESSLKLASFSALADNEDLAVNLDELSV